MILELETILVGGVILLAGFIYYFIKKRSNTKKVSSKTNRQPIAPIKLVDMDNSKNKPVKTSQNIGEKEKEIKKNPVKKKKKSSTKKKKPSSSSKKKTNKFGRIPDEELSVERVLEDLEKLVLKIEDKRKNSYDEKDIEDLLLKKLREIYESVQSQYVLEGNSRIDFNLGRGKVGIELKIAKQIFKGTKFKSLINQIREYKEAKYNENNLIVVIVGEKEYLEDRVKVSDAKNLVEEEKAHFVYIQVSD